LGRDLGAAIDIGPAMARKILKKNGSVIYIISVRPLTPYGIESPTEKKEREEFDITIEKKFGASMNKSDFKDDPDYADFVTPNYDCDEDYEVPPSKMSDIYDVKDEDDVDTYDQYFGANVRVPIGDEIRYGKVVWRKRELDGTVRGEPMPTQCWTPAFMKLSFLMAAVMSILPMRVQRICMPNVTLRAGSTSC
jgi:hypothetical protein